MEDLKTFIKTCSDTELEQVLEKLSAKRLKACAEKQEIAWHKINNLVKVVDEEIRERVNRTTLVEYKDLFYSCL